MATTNSNAFTINVIAPTSGVPSFISAAGVGVWTSISANTLSSVSFNYSGWGVAGFATTLQAIMNAWSGGAYDPVTHRLFVNGGGHNDYDGNETYVFNLSTGLWSRLDNPSPYDEGTFTGGAANTLGWNGVFPDNGPQPIHTYDVMSVNQLTGKMYRLGRSGSAALVRIQEFNPALATQQSSGTTRPAWAYKASITWPDGAHGASAWMTNESKFLIANQDGGTWIHFRRYDPATDTVAAQISSGTFSSNDMSMAHSASRQQAALFRGTNSLVLLNTSSNAVSTQTVTGATLPTGGAIEYDIARDVFWVYSDRETDRRKLFSINPSTWVATEITPTGATIGATAGDYRGIFGRFAYCADYGVLLAVNSVTGGVYIYKPAGWSAP